MTHGEIDGLLLKHVFGEDPDKPRAWYGLFLRGGRFLCECWAGIGLVVEEMRKKGWAGSCEVWPRALASLDEAAFIKESDDPDGDIIQFSQQHSSIFLAVSLAALRAVGVVIPEEEVPK